MYAYRPKDILAYEDFLMALSHPAALLDEKGQMLVCNRTLLDHIEQPTQFFRGRSIAPILAMGDQTAFTAFVTAQAAAPDETLPAFETKLQVGLISLPVSVTGFAINGQIAGYLCQGSKREAPELMRLRYLMENLDQGVWDYDPASQIFTVSNAWRTMRGIGPDVEINVPGYDWIQDVHPDDRETLSSLFHGQTQGKASSIELQYRRRHAAGHWIWILCRANVMDYDRSGKPLRIVGTDTDITQVKKKDEALQHLTNKLQMAIEVSEMGLWEYDEIADAVVWDDRILEIYGLEGSPNNRSGDLWETYIHPEDREKTIEVSEYLRKNKLDLKFDFRIVRPDGEVRHVRSLARHVPLGPDRTELIGVNIDVTEHFKRMEELEKISAQLEFDSRHDALTSVANRRLFDEVTEEFFEKAEANSNYAVLNLDIDNFKSINDRAGHAVGDDVLVAVANILVNETSPDGVVCRLGGDEFSVFFAWAMEKGEMSRICESVINSVADFSSDDPVKNGLGVSIGCAFGEGVPEDVSSIFLRADRELYAAKKAGKNCFRI